MDFLQGRAMINIHRNRISFASCFALVAVLFFLLANSAFAATEGKKQQFLVRDMYGNDHGTYDTQVQAEAAIKMISGPQGMEDVYKYVDTIKNEVIRENGTALITYWMGRKRANDEGWRYAPYGDPAPDSEEKEVKALIDHFVSESSQCGVDLSASPTGDWVGSPDQGPYPQYDWGLEYQHRAYQVNGYSEVDCGRIQYEVELQRRRRSECPNDYMSWHISDQACTNKEIFATVEVSTLQCGGEKSNGGGPVSGGNSGMVGNPCDVKTGEKFQTERDLDLGWITLTRYYHSGIALNTGGFGPGWTFSHSLHLTIQGDALGLIEGSGYAVPFRKMGAEYRAANASGERIVANGDQWVLYRQDAIYTFDAKGNLVSRMAEDGSGWVYGYNARGRLQSIASLQGRSIELVYADDNDDALITGIVSGGVQLASYGYDQQRLASVTYADGKSRIYHYEDTRFPRHLTGVTTEDGQRFSTFAYDEV
ncbi:RHS repeat domain-containing protein, partial [Xanthomonas sp. SHU 166]